MRVGESYDAWLLTIERTGASIHLVVSDLRNPIDRYEYEGTVVGDSVRAGLKNYAVGGGGCRGVRLTFTNKTYLSGRFSEDGGLFTAEVVDSIRLDSTGEEFEYHTDWTAVQQ